MASIREVPGTTYSLDAVHPATGDPLHDLQFIYNARYNQVYVARGYGWPPPWGKHGPGDPNYPAPGLLKDTRAPVTGIAEPEFWRVEVRAPQTGEMCSFVWDLNTVPGFEVPGNTVVKVLANPDLAAVGVTGDLVLTDYGPGVHKITGIPQPGITRYWVIQATLIPEPAFVSLAGMGLALAGLAWRRKR